jgi:WD40 repeat protein
VFAANGEYLVSGDAGVQVWRVEDGKQMATMQTVYSVGCLAVSKDGRWIAAGTALGKVIVWDAKTYKEVVSDWGGGCHIHGVDFSPDSTRLVCASANRTASIWDIPTDKRVQTLDHGYYVTAARYSPQGDRIATTSFDSVRVWDSNDGRLLVDIKVKAPSVLNHGLLWSNNHLFVISDSKIKQFEASTGSTVSEWRVPDSNWHSCIALPKHAGFIVYSTWRTVTFWDTATHTQLGLIQHFEDILLIAVSPYDRFLAIGGGSGKINIHSLSHISVSTLSRWITVHMNNFLAPIIFPSDSIPLSHIHSRNRPVAMTTLRSILGSTINSQMRKHYESGQNQNWRVASGWRPWLSLPT